MTQADTATRPPAAPELPRYRIVAALTIDDPATFLGPQCAIAVRQNEILYQTIYKKPKAI